MRSLSHTQDRGLAPRPTAWDRKIRNWYFSLVALVFFLPFPFILPINNPNENVRVYMTMALVEEHTFRIDSIVARHGWTNDMAKVPHAVTATGPFTKAANYELPGASPRPLGDSYYSVKSPGVSYLGVPAYAAFLRYEKLAGRAIPKASAPEETRRTFFRRAVWWMRLSVQLPCFLFLLFFERFLRRFSPDAVFRYAAVTAAGLGTNYLAYSLMFASHALFAATAFTAFGLITAARLDASSGLRLPPKFRGAFFAGLFAGLTTLTDYQGFLLSVLLGLYALCIYWRPKHLLAFALGGLGPALGMMLFHLRAFGSPFTPGHKFCETAEFAQKHAQGFYGFTKPDFHVLGQLSASYTFGFFGTSSFMWIALPAALFLLIRPRALSKGRWVRRLVAFMALTMMAALFLALASANNWRGGWTVGPRLLGAAPPFFAFLAAWGASRIGENRKRLTLFLHALTSGFAAASVLQSGLLGVLCNTIPENVSRPVPDIAFPLLRAGFVPHTLLGAVGLPQAGFAVVLFALGGAALLPMFVRPLQSTRLEWPSLPLRYMLAPLFFLLGAFPAFAPTWPGEPLRGEALGTVKYLVGIWEPAGIDRRSVLLERLAAPKAKPCVAQDLAQVERSLGFVEEAVAHEREAITRKCAPSGHSW